MQLASVRNRTRGCRASDGSNESAGRVPGARVSPVIFASTGFMALVDAPSHYCLRVGVGVCYVIGRHVIKDAKANQFGWVCALNSHYVVARVWLRLI